jgi:hypothetical protein
MKKRWKGEGGGGEERERDFAQFETLPKGITFILVILM